MKYREINFTSTLESILYDDHREQRSQSTSIERSSKKLTKVSDSSFFINDIDFIFLN